MQIPWQNQPCLSYQSLEIITLNDFDEFHLANDTITDLFETANFRSIYEMIEDNDVIRSINI